MKKNSKAKKGVAIFCFAIIAVLVVGTAAILSYNISSGGGNLWPPAIIGDGGRGNDNNPDNPNTPKEPEILNILVLGLDDEASLPDIMLAVRMDLDSGKVDVVSVPRDTLVDITPQLRADFADINRSGYLPRGDNLKLNEMFTRAGVSSGNGLTFVNNHIESILGLKFDYYVTLRLPAFRFIVDDIGGVYMDVPRRLFYNGITIDGVHHPGQLVVDIHPGWQRLNGSQAEQVIRFRQYPDGDLGRIAMTQLFMQAFFTQLLTTEAIMNNPMSLFNSFATHINTNIGLPDAIRYSANPVVGSLDTDNITFHTVPGAGRNIGGVSYFIIDEEATVRMMEEIIGNAEDDENDEIAEGVDLELEM
ncbi:MAG: LCP family protein [Defluviitaleaceae bacterium]|nr:LCP family protein [Defluviitaleaceae bacterium]